MINVFWLEIHLVNRHVKNLFLILNIHVIKIHQHSLNAINGGPSLLWHIIYERWGRGYWKWGKRLGDWRKGQPGRTKIEKENWAGKLEPLPNICFVHGFKKGYISHVKKSQIFYVLVLRPREESYRWICSLFKPGWSKGQLERIEGLVDIYSFMYYNTLILMNLSCLYNFISFQIDRLMESMYWTKRFNMHCSKVNKICQKKSPMFSYAYKHNMYTWRLSKYIILRLLKNGKSSTTQLDFANGDGNLDFCPSCTWFQNQLISSSLIHIDMRCWLCISFNAFMTWRVNIDVYL